MFHSCVLGWSSYIACITVAHLAQILFGCSHVSSDRENVHKSFLKIRDFFSDFDCVV